jgi:N-acetyl sugar amidotransferase
MMPGHPVHTRSIVYCRRCVMPSTKPDLQFDDQGICSACRYYERRADVDWGARSRDLQAVLERYRSNDESRHDCIIPVSGGKDSTFQVLTLLQLGMNPLCVTASTDRLSPIGRRNLDNLKVLGVDHIEVSANPLVRRRINRLALTQVGDISWPEHVTIFTVPVRIAVQFGIPLLIWGENSQHEYGGPAAAADNHILNRRWLEEFGGLLGLRVADLVGHEGISGRDLLLYQYPSDAELQRTGVTGLFLGHYVPWDGYQNALTAQAHGFETYPHAVEGALLNYENLDNLYHGIHDYFKFLKFGFGRATDHACLHIRRGRLRREDAIRIVRERDGRFPWTYLGCPLEDLLRDLGITLLEFEATCDRFTNKRLFQCDTSGRLIKDAGGNLTKLNYDNRD